MSDFSLAPTVFVSYSHKDEYWKNQLLPHLRALEQAGEISVWDDRKIDGGEDWYPEITREMERAAVAICMISPDYLASSFCMKEEVPFLLERRERDGMALIPLLVRPCTWTAFDWLKNIQMMPSDGGSVLVEYKGIEDKVFADIAHLVMTKLTGRGGFHERTRLPETLRKIFLDRLPQTGAELFGRHRELHLLDEAWLNDEVNLVGLVAEGGVGKSTLVNEWLKSMKRQDYLRAKRVYGWSFYSQGDRHRITSADEFIDHALRWFDDPEPNAGSPWEKGKRLARLISSERTLLILDGLEPLQHGGGVDRGRIREPALSVLVKALGRRHNGLCVVTTRQPLSDLIEFGRSVCEQDLNQISPKAGRALLRVRAVRGTDAELEQASSDYGNHALAIKLLPVFLQKVAESHISSTVSIPAFNVSTDGPHWRRVLVALTRVLEPSEREVLRILGLFDRPADAGCVSAIRHGPPIPDLTSNLHSLAEADWLALIDRLRRAALIAPVRSSDPEELDAHPLIREHFGEELKREHPVAWQEGHRRIYKHLKSSAEVFPNTVKAMVPLLAAVYHGCQAERHQEAFDEVYWHRINRGERVNLSNRGAFSSHLAALSNFFQTLWSTPIEGLREDTKLELLDLAGLCTWALGNPVDAEQLFLKASVRLIADGNLNLAARTLCNLSAVSRIRGQLEQAATYARQALDFAERNLDPKTYSFRIISAKVTLADALHQAGKTSEAGRLFEEAEELHQEKQRHEIPLLYGREGYQFCDFLLDQGEFRTVQRRVQLTLRRAKNFKRNRHVALDQLSLGRALLIQAKSEDASKVGESGEVLEQAIEGLREIGMAHHLPPALLVYAELLRFLGRVSDARYFVEEAQQIAVDGMMQLYVADCYLEYARQDLGENRRHSAKENCERARDLIDCLGYHRRDRDLLEILQQIDN